MKPKLTPWFPATTKPVRKGIYEVRLEVEWEPTPFPYYCWNGKFWEKDPGRTPSEARPCRMESVFARQCYWRGLARKP